MNKDIIDKIIREVDNIDWYTDPTPTCIKKLLNKLKEEVE